MYRLSCLLLALAGSAFVACSSDAQNIHSDAASDSASDAASDAGTGPDTVSFSVRMCSDGEAPLVTGQSRGETLCTRVGAIATPLTDIWPDTRAARQPLVYVNPAAPAGGDGSIALPFRTIAEASTALDTSGNGTIVLSATTHAIDSTIAFTHDVAVLGFAGPQGSIVTAPAASAAFSASVAGTTIDLHGVNFTVNHEGAVVVASNDANLVVRDVFISGSTVGIQLSEGTDVASPGGHLDADGLTITDASAVGIHVGARGSALVRSTRIESPRVGIKTTGSALEVRDSLVRNASAAGISADFSSRASGGTFVLDHAAIVDATGLGIWIGGAGGTATVSRTLVGGTRAVAGVAGTGVGMLVTAGAMFAVDPDLATEAVQGFGSVFVANEGTGMLVDRAANGKVHGCFFGSNQQSGVVIQSNARVDEIAYSYFADNHGSSLLVSTGGVIAGLLCNGFVGSVAGALPFTSGSQILLDGILIQPAVSLYTVVVAGNTIADSPRYGLLAVGVDVVLMNNTFRDNPSGIAVVDGSARGSQAPDVSSAPGADALSANPPGSLTTGGAP